MIYIIDTVIVIQGAREPMQNYLQFSKRIGLIGISNILLGFSGVILLPILTKNMSITDYGLWAQIGVTVNLIPFIMALGLPYTMVRFINESKSIEEIRECFYTILLLVSASCMILSSIFLIFCQPLASLLFNDNVYIFIMVIFLSFLGCINMLLLNFFRSLQQVKRYTMLSSIKTYVSVLLVSYLVLSGYGIIGGTLGLLITEILAFAVMLLLIISQIGVGIPHFKNIREYLSFGIPTIPGNLSSWVVNASDRYVIGILMNEAAVGYYTPGYTLGNLITMFSSPIAIALPPVITKNYDEDNIAEVKNILNFTLKYFLILAIPSVFGLSILSKQILSILSTPEIAMQGYVITPFVALSALFFGAYMIIVQIIILEKRTMITGWIWILSGVVNIALTFILVRAIGTVGAAIATLISFFMVFVITYYYSRHFRFVNLGPFFLSKAMIASVIMSLVVIVLNPYDLITILASILGGAVIYFSILYALKTLNANEVSFIKTLLKIS